MIALFDTNFLSILFNDRTPIPRDSNGVMVVPDAQARIDLLVSELSKAKTKIILPTPVLAEFMFLASESWTQYLDLIRRKAVFEIAGFDDAAAVELVKICLLEGKPRTKHPSETTKAKIRFDRQIIAIAKARRVETVYSTDDGIHRVAARIEIQCRNLIDLPPPGPKQLSLEVNDQRGNSNVLSFPEAAHKTEQSG